MAALAADLGVGQTSRDRAMTRPTVLALVVGIVGFCGAGVLYNTLDLREPRRTRALLARFSRGDLSAWDEYKMDPPRTARAVPALLEGMRDSSPTVRERSVVGVCGLSADAVVVAALRELANDTERPVKEAARRCLAFDYHSPVRE